MTVAGKHASTAAVLFTSVCFTRPQS